MKHHKILIVIWEDFQELIKCYIRKQIKINIREDISISKKFGNDLSYSEEQRETYRRKVKELKAEGKEGLEFYENIEMSCR